MKASPSTAQELDLAISDMDSQEAEDHVRSILGGLQGIEAVLLIQRGAFIRHRASITSDQIRDAIRRGGYSADSFQENAGRTRRSSP